METLVIELTNAKAYKLIEDMQELNLIRVIRKSSNVASLRGSIKTPMSNDDIDRQIGEIRAEW